MADDNTCADNNCLTFQNYPGAGLGNYMFFYATTLAIALQNKRTPVMDGDLIEIYERWFEHLSIKRIHKGSKNEYETVQLWKFNHFYEDIYAKLDKIAKNVKLDGYMQSWKYFHNFSDVIRRDFTFRKSIQAVALHVIESIKTNQSKSGKVESFIFVGIHVRRGDFLNTDRLVGSDAYILRAMHYVQAHYRQMPTKTNLIFLMVGQDSAWQEDFMQKLIASRAKFNLQILKPHSPAVDMCVLTMCDHVISTVGTFGWWAAYLSGGIKLYQRQIGVENSTFKAEFDLEDQFPPSWIGLDM